MTREEFYVLFKQAYDQAMESKSVQEIADCLRMSRTTVERWASGRNCPTLGLREPVIRKMNQFK